MGMRATTVRFTEDLWRLVDHEATFQGISAAQFVRDAALLRAATLIGQRGDEGEVRDVEAVARGSLRPAAVTDPTPVPVPVPSQALDAPLRLTRLRETGLMDGASDPALDRLARAARTVLYAPVALVSLVDHERQVFACALGLAEPWATRRSTPLSHSFCRHAVVRNTPLVVQDARCHPDLHDHPAIADLGVVAYLGIPLVTLEGVVLGTLCVIDHEPRAWSHEQVATMTDLAYAAVAQLERRIANANANADANADADAPLVPT